MANFRTTSYSGLGSFKFGGQSEYNDKDYMFKDIRSKSNGYAQNQFQNGYNQDSWNNNQMTNKSYNTGGMGDGYKNGSWQGSQNQNQWSGAKRGFNSNYDSQFSRDTMNDRFGINMVRPH